MISRRFTFTRGRLLSVLLLLLLPALLFGCKGSTDPTPPDSDSNTPPSPPVVETPVYPDDWTGNREMLIEENRSLDDTRFSAASVWAEQWATDRFSHYGASGAAATMVSGAYAPDALWDGLSVCCTLWEVSFDVTEPVPGFSLNDDARTVARVQTISVTKDDAAFLSGCLPGEEALTRIRPIYDYIGEDPRFAELRREWPADLAGKDVSVLNLTEAAGRNIFSVYLPDRNTLAAVGEAKDGYWIGAFRMPDLALQYEGQVAEHISDVSASPSGGLRLELLAEQDDGSFLPVYARLTPGGTIASAPPEDLKDAVYPLPGKGGQQIAAQDGSLYLTGGGQDTLLLKGGFSSEGDPTSETAYRFVAAVDDHRFAYVKIGYEWVEGSGVFDLSTMTDHPLLIDGKGYGWQAVAVAGDRVLAVYSDAGSPVVPAVMSLSDYSATAPLGLPGDYADGEMGQTYAFSPSGDVFASLSFFETYGVLSLYNVDSGLLLESHRLGSPISVPARLYFPDDGQIVVASSAMALCDQMLYLVTPHD